jgi:hypothetical protein
MASTAATIIGEWNSRSSSTENQNQNSKVGLIAVSFDQRNHGTRMADEASNGAWREGNKTHAQDMFRYSILKSHVFSY